MLRFCCSPNSSCTVLSSCLKWGTIYQGEEWEAMFSNFLSFRMTHLNIKNNSVSYLFTERCKTASLLQTVLKCGKRNNENFLSQVNIMTAICSLENIAQAFLVSNINIQIVFSVAGKMNAKFHLLVFLIILGTITGECSFKYWWRPNVGRMLLSEFLNMTIQIKLLFGSHVTVCKPFSLISWELCTRELCYPAWTWNTTAGELLLLSRSMSKRLWRLLITVLLCIVVQQVLLPF